MIHFIEIIRLDEEFAKCLKAIAKRFENPHTAETVFIFCIMFKIETFSEFINLKIYISGTFLITIAINMVFCS